MFKKIFVNVMLAPVALWSLLSIVFTGKFNLIWFIIGLLLVVANLSWCARHLRKKVFQPTTSDDDLYGERTYANLDNVESPKIGSTLKRGIDLHK